MRILVTQKDIYKIAEKLALRDKKVNNLLDIHKAFRAVIEKIEEIINCPISDSEKITKVESIVNTLEVN